jgi:two-component sensor histidine kinase
MIGKYIQTDLRGKKIHEIINLLQIIRELLDQETITFSDQTRIGLFG